MSANKYANLPDIDTAPDIYETEDVFPSSQAEKGNSSDEENALPPRSAKGRNGEGSAGKDELDSNNLIGTEEARKKFRKAERKRARSRTRYAYPPSPDSPTGRHLDPANPRPVPLSHRLRALQAELSALETEIADPSNPLLHQEREEDNVDPGELIRGLVDVRGRLDKIRKGKEGRGKLVAALGDTGEMPVQPGKGTLSAIKKAKDDAEKGPQPSKDGGTDVRSIVEMDRRVGELEKLVGSSGAALDELSPLPPPLLPQITRLNAQLTLLTQPRHIDSISRRLKLLLSDLDRVSASQHRKPSSNQQQSSSSSPLPPGSTTEAVVPLLTRLAPSLPHIPHILTRLRTLSTLHTAAGEFQSTLESLEKEQLKVRDGLVELQQAVNAIEASLEGNRTVVKGNVEGLEERVDILLRRLEEVGVK